MNGIGTVPAGSTPCGLYNVPTAPVSVIPTSPYATVTPQLNPATGELVQDERGALVMADGVAQRVLLRLKTRRLSSVVAWLGSELHRIDRITDNHVKRVDAAVRSALDDMVRSGEIAIVAITVQRIGSSGLFTRIKWRDLTTNREQDTELT